MSVTSNKEAVGLAGEYAVAAELCKRGFYAQLTLGNHKKTDLIVENAESKAKRQLFRVSVKSKTGATWPQVKGIWEEGDLLVLVDFRGKGASDRPEFYVLTVQNWKSIVKKLGKSSRGYRGKIDRTNTLEWLNGDGTRKWYGCAVNAKDVKKFQDKWVAP